MKKILAFIIITIIATSCKTATTSNTVSTKPNNNEISVYIDLINITDDKVAVTTIAPEIATDEIIFNIPKTVPGTYSTDNYGKLIDNFQAIAKNGSQLAVTKIDDNSWKIANAKTLAKINYLVNDTFDTEKGSGFGDGIFSPAGSNIEKEKNFFINNHCFVGFFEGKKDLPYKLKITHPSHLQAATSLVDSDSGVINDLFVTPRYAELVDNPIMYSKPDFITFNVDGMDILFSVYSPTGKHTAKALSADLEKMMRAQKAFLGPINNNKKYTVLLYLSDVTKPDAKGYGALEHSSSTTVVFPEMMPSTALGKQIIDVVSHEFFHIVTPLGVHSNEIHYFDFNNPKMSKHLWMYEGVTEYFANLFQVNQGLITDAEFYERMAQKINNAKYMNDTMSFTTMSANVLQQPYKDQYLNVYEKGALIGMCMDIIIREKSNGQRGRLDMMHKLTNEYGPEKPFHDDELFNKIVALTYPEVGQFITNHIEGTTPINYDEFFAKVGVAKSTIKTPTNCFLNGNTPGIRGDYSTKTILVRDTELSNFMKTIGLQANDIITEINGKSYNYDTLAEMITEAQNWKENENCTIKVQREGKEKLLKGKVILSYTETQGYQLNDKNNTLNNYWLKK